MDHEIEIRLFGDNGCTSNNPVLPLVIMGATDATAVDDPAARFEDFFVAYGWGAMWLSALGRHRILDIDVTVKLLLGHHQGAKIGDNLQKPGRPRHVDHSYFVVKLRIGFGVEVRPGIEHAASKGLAGHDNYLGELLLHPWPTWNSDECGYDSEVLMLEHVDRNLPYLFKLRHTAKAKEPFTRMMRQGALWEDSGDGGKAAWSQWLETGKTRHFGK